MKQVNRYFVSGAAFAVVLLGLFMGNTMMQLVFASPLGHLPRELRLAVEANLISVEQTSSNNLRNRISRSQFASQLGTALNLLGEVETSDSAALKATGLFNSNSRTALTRGEVLETLARATLFFAHKDMIKMPSEAAVDFRDYAVEQKYSQAIAYLQQKFVARGFPDGSFGKNRHLTFKQSVFFIYRFYEAISADMMNKKLDTGIRFVDLPLNHPVMGSISVLTKAGAFDRVFLRSSLDGNSYIKSGELSDIISGVFARARIEIDHIRMRTIFSDHSSSSEVNRSELAVLLDYVLSSLCPAPEIRKTYLYSDVPRTAPEYTALGRLSAAGIRMGYNNNLFAGHESTTWFEAINLLRQVIDKTESGTGRISEPDKLATKDDINRIIAVIRAKREKVHQILNRKYK